MQGKEISWHKEKPINQNQEMSEREGEGNTWTSSKRSSNYPSEPNMHTRRKRDLNEGSDRKA